MRLTFLGTRGLAEGRCDRHRWHTSMAVSYRGRTVMVDCGTDWEDKVRRLEPGAIVLTHAHSNCAGGLKQGAPCPVHAPRRTWDLLRDTGVERGKVIRCRRPSRIQGILFEAFPVDHSVNAPTVGYRITTNGICIFYAPDVARIHYRHEALRGVDLYIGDGSILDDRFLTSRAKRAVASVPTQLTWCRKEGIPRAIITHCGMEVVAGDPEWVSEQVQAQGRDRGVEARLAHDGLELVLQPRQN